MILAITVFFKLNYMYQTEVIRCLKSDCEEGDLIYVSWAFMEAFLFMGYYVCHMVYLAGYWLSHAFYEKEGQNDIAKQNEDILTYLEP